MTTTKPECQLPNKPCLSHPRGGGGGGEGGVKFVKFQILAAEPYIVREFGSYNLQNVICKMEAPTPWPLNFQLNPDTQSRGAKPYL